MKKLFNQKFLYKKNLKDINSKELLALNNGEPMLLFETEKGKVYSMPPDNMHCLNPDFHSNMPVSKNAPEIYIPNGLNLEKKLR